MFNFIREPYQRVYIRRKSLLSRRLSICISMRRIGDRSGNIQQNRMYLYDNVTKQGCRTYLACIIHTHRTNQRKINNPEINNGGNKRTICMSIREYNKNSWIPKRAAPLIFLWWSFRTMAEFARTLTLQNYLHHASLQNFRIRLVNMR